jgi:hypothetical protein
MPSLLPAGAPARLRVRWRIVRIVVLLAIVLGLVWLWWHRFGEPEDFDHMEAQFKYGSIGSDHPLAQAPLPYWLWKVLPEVFPPGALVPKPMSPDSDKASFEAFGLVVEAQRELPSGYVAGQPAFERPIGFSRRRVFGMDFVGMNCSFCHLGTLKADEHAPRQIVLGGTGNAVDIEKYFLFLFAALTDPRFDADTMMPAIERELTRQNATLPWLQRQLYRYVVIPLLPRYLKWLEKNDFDFINPRNPNHLPPFGPGRVDTWALYKRTFVEPSQHDSIPGAVDFPSLWNQKAREGMRMHWDGNTDVLLERNIVSALSLIGTRIEYLDFDRLTRVTDWIIGLLPPRYVDRFPQKLVDTGQTAIDAALAGRGAVIFGDQCGRCHSAQGDRIGRVEPIDDLGTDPTRIEEFTPQLADALNKLGTDRWKLRNFRLQNGYVDTPLDGLWLRAPYLHNGSVPTLRDLLKPPAERPKRFCRGGEVYDWKNLGFLSATELASNGRDLCPGGFRYNTLVSGNSNKGHLYGTTLSEADKDALIEFLKTL